MSIKSTAWTDGQSTPVETHVGLVVGTGDTYLGDCDTDFYAIVFDPESCEFTTAGHSHSPINATIDAPEDVMEAYRLHEEVKSAKRRAAAALNQVRERLIEEMHPRAGRRVTVVRGRKVPLGTEGIVQVYCESNYGGMRVKFVADDGVEHWTDAYNVEVIALEQVSA